MPGFIALNAPPASAQNFGSAFLPAIYQGTKVGRGQQRGGPAFRMGNDSGSQVRILPMNGYPAPPNANRSTSFKSSTAKSLNARSTSRRRGMIESYELAFRMQDTLPEMMDISKESESTLDLYGIGQGNTDGFGRQCLLARRFVESGVRFVEITHGNWDHHSGYRRNFPNHAGKRSTYCGIVNRSQAARITRRYAGGLGWRIRSDSRCPKRRRSRSQSPRLYHVDGRRGVKGGLSYGATDEHGYQASRINVISTTGMRPCFI